jgi:hypothetical protein
MMARTNVTPDVIRQLAAFGGWWSSQNESRNYCVSVRYSYYLGPKGDTSRQLNAKQMAKFTTAMSGRVQRLENGTLRVVSEDARSDPAAVSRLPAGVRRSRPVSADAQNVLGGGE